MAVPQQPQPQPDLADDGDDARPQLIILSAHNPLPVVPRIQEGFYSCWSTSAEMIMEFLGRHVRQCEQASRAEDTGFWCCDGERLLNRHPDCDSPDYPDFARWGFKFEERTPLTPLSWPDVVNEIDGGRPFAFSWMRNDLNTTGSPISHMLVAVGYNQTGGDSTRVLFCLNPRPFAAADEIMVYFSEYSNSSSSALTATPGIAPRGHTHQSDYFDIHPVPLPATTP